MAHDFKKFPELTNAQMNFYYLESPHKQITEGFMGKVVKVIDGDTIRIKCEFRDFDFPVRFINTAAPEKDEEGGLKSKSWLEEQINKEEVYIKINPSNRVEKWGRLLGEIFFLGRNINQESIETGHAIKFEDLDGWL
jgi:endonuclease YncB( thermonuclease family)